MSATTSATTAPAASRSAGAPGTAASHAATSQPANQLVDRLERAEALDSAAGAVSHKVHDVLDDAGTTKDALHGVWLGHPLHPALVQIPFGAYLSAAVLDLVPGAGPYADVLVAVGLAATAPAVATGLTDFSELHPQQQRVGLVHAVGNAVASSLYAGSLVARLRGRRATGVALSFAGLAVSSTAAFLGGHLAYRQAAGANHAEDVSHLVEPGWHRLATLAELPDGRPVQLVLGAELMVPVVAVRRGPRVDVLADRCSHLAGPLHEGDVVQPGDVRSGDGACLRCPWHGSTFRLADGAVVTGPATAPQPVFDVRIDGDDVHVRLASAG